MAWTDVVTIAVGNKLTAALWNQYVRDNFHALKGIAGKIYLNNAVNLQGADIATRFIEVTSTIAQRMLRVKGAANIVLDYGQVNVGAVNADTTLSTAAQSFTAGLFSAAPQVVATVSNDDGTVNNWLTCSVASVSASNFVIRVHNTGSSESACKVDWFAIGPTAT